MIGSLTRTEEADDVQVKKRLEKVSKTLQMMPALLKEYDDKTVRQTIKKIVVVDEDYLKITFVNGEEKQVRMKER